MKVFCITAEYIEDGARIVAADTLEEAKELARGSGLEDAFGYSEEVKGATAEPPARVLHEV